MEPDQLRDHLRDRGLFVLYVSRHPTDAQAYIVYLHGYAGQSANGHAQQIIEQVPGVTSAVESFQTSAILLVRTQPSASA
jgi:hypothetical protein